MTEIPNRRQDLRWQRAHTFEDVLPSLLLDACPLGEVRTLRGQEQRKEGVSRQMVGSIEVVQILRSNPRVMKKAVAAAAEPQPFQPIRGVVVGQQQRILGPL
jgi:hypothetical protein